MGLQSRPWLSDFHFHLSHKEKSRGKLLWVGKRCSRLMISSKVPNSTIALPSWMCCLATLGAPNVLLAATAVLKARKRQKLERQHQLHLNFLQGNYSSFRVFWKKTLDFINCVPHSTRGTSGEVANRIVMTDFDNHAPLLSKLLPELN